MIKRIDFDGSIWTYDDEKSKRGPICVEPKDRGCAMDIQEALPLRSRTFWNPATLSFVSYSTARQLGINTEYEPPVYL